MKNNNLNIKNFRNETLKITAEDFAKRLGISEEMIARYEENPQEIPVGIMVKISEEFGIPMQRILNYEHPGSPTFEIKNSWSKIENIKRRINLYLAENHGDFANEQHERILGSIRALTAKLTAKPKIVLLGRSDSGKSTLTNRLIGAEKLHADWQPMTAIIIYIKHINKYFVIYNSISKI